MATPPRLSGYPVFNIPYLLRFATVATAWKVLLDPLGARSSLRISGPSWGSLSLAGGSRVVFLKHFKLEQGIAPPGRFARLKIRALGPRRTLD